ncbi:phosphoribosylformylglycinamidine synthase [Bacteriovorax stolpii]|uniref:Phosphoribosylformylglycinamidine synthase n=1 Tax=Bacteriovorax stolpii TaxID=960 RepID=A0A2K9NQN2_BACTC|nr:phosphoribosylformylglycinamidine synthase subunit PurQ [Bacteriovorax stolpii]AUN97836.1 phosphoribosylformylglycinamidine synthase [Bacteriovorax stolpii]TDP51663.1 phosphoribosylformylglycinamidine synthase subunit I [Bacteriovorax stolpii]
MKREQIKALILTGDGINCEAETALAFTELGAQAEIIHISDLIENKNKLKEAQILALPGGFSFGDEIGSGQILALKLKYALGEELKTFVEEKKLVIGICNGFQALVRLGLLPKPFSKRTMTLTHNRQGHFINRWVDLDVPVSECVWTSELRGEKISLPIRHGEGRIVFKGNEEEQRATYKTLSSNGQIALSYRSDVNGSFAEIAGVCDPSGLIFGLMPHPEAAISLWHNPGGADKGEDKGLGLFIFESGLKYCEANL